MQNAYRKMVEKNLRGLFQDPGKKDLAFQAFGKACRVSPEGIYLDGKKEEGVLGVLISLYLMHAGKEALILEPFRAFKDLPGSAPYASAFAARAQQVLVPHVKQIQAAREALIQRFDGIPEYAVDSGDFSFILRPFPKIALCYIFYLADADFPASATCLFSNNALAFAPIDVLADTAEYTSRAILERVI